MSVWTFEDCAQYALGTRNIKDKQFVQAERNEQHVMTTCCGRVNLNAHVLRSPDVSFRLPYLLGACKHFVFYRYEPGHGGC